MQGEKIIIIIFQTERKILEYTSKVVSSILMSSLKISTDLDGTQTRQCLRSEWLFKYWSPLFLLSLFLRWLWIRSCISLVWICSSESIGYFIGTNVGIHCERSCCCCCCCWYGRPSSWRRNIIFLALEFEKYMYGMYGMIFIAAIRWPPILYCTPHPQPPAKYFCLEVLFSYHKKHRLFVGAFSFVTLTLPYGGNTIMILYFILYSTKQYFLFFCSTAKSKSWSCI